MNAKEMQNFRSRIEQEITGLEESAASIKNEIRESSEVCARPTGDALDCAKDERDLKSQIEIHNHTRARITELHGALRRMENGGFGICQECGDHIGARRLQARPGAFLCIGCQEHNEHAFGVGAIASATVLKFSTSQAENCKAA